MSMMAGAAPRFSIGAALSMAFQVLRRRFWSYLLIMLITTAPGLALMMFEPFQSARLKVFPSDGDPISLWVGLGASLLVEVLAYGVSAGAVTYAVVSDLRGREARLGEALGASVARLGHTVPTILAQAVIVLLGAALLVVPGVVLSLFLFVCVQTSAAEKVGPGVALARSRFLTRGYRWPLLGLMVIAIVASGLVGALAGFLTAAILSAGVGSEPEMLASEFFVVSEVAVALLSLPVIGYFAIVPAVVYFQLSMEKDGRDQGDVVAVFR